MKRLSLLLGCLFSLAAHAYSARELRADCLAAEDFFMSRKSDPYQSIQVARCLSYVAGFADGFGVADYLADKVGLRLNAICTPQQDDLAPRLVRAVLAHLDRQPPETTSSTATLVASALAKAFPCEGSEDKNSSAPKK